MSRFLSFRDGGKTDEEGISRYVSKLFGGEVITGLQVTQQSPVALGVAVSAGDVMVPSGNDYPYIGWNDASLNITINTADGSNPRYDLIVAYVDLSVVDSTNPNNPGAFEITNVTGTPAGSPVEPNNAAIEAVIGGGNPYVILARVTVGTGVTSITNSNIQDRRTMAYTNVLSQESGNGGYLDLDNAPSAVTAYGNRSYQLTFANEDLTDILTEGMRLRLEQTVLSPTQSTSLNGSTQYWNKTSSINKLTFTDDFVCSAWVYLDAITGNSQAILSRYNGTSGFIFFIDGNGRVGITGYNGSASNFSEVKSYASIPVKQWVHVTVQLDMSAFTATTTTSYAMINGVDVPAVVARGGTNPTALVQAGNIEIGSTNGGAIPFGGKIAQAAIYSAKILQATALNAMHQGLSGSETNLASAWSFNGVATDLNTTTPNNLSAVASAGYTSDSPFAGGSRSQDTAGSIDHAVIMAKPVFSTNTTVVVQVPEGYTIPVSGGISGAKYSTQKAPYGFPADKTRWAVECIGKLTITQSSPTAQQWYWSSTGSQKLDFPIGTWEVEMQGCVYGEGGSANFLDPEVTLNTNNTSSTSNTGNIGDFTSRVATVVDTVVVNAYMLRGFISVATMTSHYRKIRMVNAGRTVVGNYVTTAAQDHLRIIPTCI